MTNSIIHIDVSKLDSRISKLQKELDEVMNERDAILRIIEKYAVDPNKTDAKSVQDFIIHFLNGGKKRVDHVIAAYSRSAGIEKEESTPLVNEAIEGLRILGDVETLYDPQLKRRVVYVTKKG